jgi:hypothetical protein
MKVFVKLNFVKFEVFTAVPTISNIFRNVMPCSLAEIYRRFGGISVNFYETTRLHIPDDGTLQAKRRLMKMDFPLM